jgi:hypothetical protein
MVPYLRRVCVSLCRDRTRELPALFIVTCNCDSIVTRATLYNSLFPCSSFSPSPARESKSALLVDQLPSTFYTETEQETAPSNFFSGTSNKNFLFIMDALSPSSGAAPARPQRPFTEYNVSILGHENGQLPTCGTFMGCR